MIAGLKKKKEVLRPAPRKAIRGPNRRLTIQEQAHRALEKHTRLLITRVKLGKPLTAQGHAELQAIANGHQSGKVPPYANQAQMAKIICETFNVQIGRQQINQWIHKEGAPAPDDANRIRTADFIEWAGLKKYPRQGNGSNGAGGQTELFQKAEESEALLSIQNLERERFEFEILRGAFIKKSDHQRILAGLGKEIWPAFCNLVELQLISGLQEQLRDLGILEAQAVQIIAGARSRHQKAIDAIQTQFSRRLEKQIP
jgi:hypothetical protein